MAESTLTPCENKPTSTVKKNPKKVGTKDNGKLKNDSTEMTESLNCTPIIKDLLSQVDSIDLLPPSNSIPLAEEPSHNIENKECIPPINKYKATETTIINGNTYELLNGLPIFETNEVFAERFKIYERETYIDSQGIGYFCTDIDCDQLELFVRIDKKKNTKTVLKTEYKLLKAAEDDSKHIYFSQIHSVGEYDDFIYMAIYFKSGPTLKDITRFMGKRQFSHGTIGRFAFDLFSILQKVHEYGYLLHNIGTEKFTFDACSRSIYLNDYTYIKPDQSKLIPPVKDLYKNPSKYLGSSDYSPFYFLEADVFPPPPGIFARDELEAAFYMILDLLLGDLPWKSLRRNEVLSTKKEFILREKIFKELPKEYKQIWETITSSDKYDSMVYPKLLDLCKDIYKNLGNIEDLDDNYDFEVEPNPEDIPRFILEKRPIENDNSETIQSPA
ncbi:Protein kinase-like domain-containing protein [Strongyloides ratti]|uniref:Protein kinase-like domain-containing protein n=1 Tax=Strongyloides ratti TaxID=34506 RepID=A0A090LLX8_STRRB|nr:Protein kinase-like domain-containing protein [Strongyloides ratti]CEF68570.1 Protein kinase-like domain-containing protein [Strongyloides ratti]